MQLEKQGAQNVVLNHEDTVVVVGMGGELPVGFENSLSVGVFAEEDAGYINSTGEYQYRNVDMILLDTKEQKDGVPTLYKLTLDHTEVLVVPMCDFEVSKQDLEVLGDVNVVVADFAKDQSSLNKLIKKLAPNLIVAVNADPKSASEVVEMEAEQVTKKLKINSKDFQAEDYSASFYVLE